ncbi:MlaE family ABC transporter permease [Pseudonocardia spinosispora]|uniref:MlaE family ABC transporter permease n=1 Tax=Pseudonocardia spinosispora TaxID=103441 RepID=UPI001FDF271F|nr:ABC transporter permease [Pseudonocardia spinosispora]
MLEATTPSAAAVHTGPTATRHRPGRTAVLASGAVGGVARALEQAGGMTILLARVVRTSVGSPLGYWGEVRDQMYEILKLCWMPMMVSCVAFGFGAPGLQGGNFFSLFGMPERLGSFFIMASVREFAPWINAMVVAGVIGTSITADLGARRIREEFDAMEVLGVDPIRVIILPRVVALVIMTGLMDLVALVFGVLGGWLAAFELGADSDAFFANFWANATTTDMWGSVVKTFMFGLIVGIVCAYKGYHAQGGPMGVGRAVNQAVVIAFALIYSTNYVFTALLLGLHPYMQVYR